MTDLKNKWVLEWSKNQKCFHIETVEEMISRNANSFLANRATEYIPIFFCNTQNEAHAFADKLKKLHCDSVIQHHEKWDAIWQGKFA